MNGLHECRFCGAEFDLKNERATDHEEGCYVRESYEKYPGLWPDRVPDAVPPPTGLIWK